MVNSYGFGKTVSYSFDEAIDKVTQELQKECFWNTYGNRRCRYL